MLSLKNLARKGLKQDPDSITTLVKLSQAFHFVGTPMTSVPTGLHHFGGPWCPGAK